MRSGSRSASREVSVGAVTVTAVDATRPLPVLVPLPVPHLLPVPHPLPVPHRLPVPLPVPHPLPVPGIHNENAGLLTHG